MIEQFKLIFSNSDDAMDMILWFWMALMFWALLSSWIDDKFHKDE